MGAGKAMPCRTPGTIYETKIEPDGITFKVKLPRPLLADTTAEAQKALAKRVHDAALPIIENLYRETWASHFANRFLVGHCGRMPEKWEHL